jgi:hypothetical protein
MTPTSAEWIDSAAFKPDSYLVLLLLWKEKASIQSNTSQPTKSNNHGRAPVSHVLTVQIYCYKVHPPHITSSRLMMPQDPHLTHLSMEGDGSESKISEQQSCSLSIVTGATEDHKGVSSQFI